MNLRFVEAFYWVATLRSVSRAAEKLFLTQSAMSARIAALEEELGVLLLDRRDKQFRLTVAGARFLSHAQKLLDLQREAKAELRSGAPQRVALRLGAIESVLHSWLIPWLEKLRGEQPALEFELTVETTAILLDQLRRGALDLIFAVAPLDTDRVHTKALGTMEMVFVGHAAVHRKRRYRLAELAQGELLTFQRGSQPHVALLDLLQQSGVEARRLHAISSISAMVQLVDGKFGAATLPRAVIERIPGVPSLRVLRCDPPLADLSVHVSWRSDPAADTIDEVVRSALTFVTTTGSVGANRKNR